jgi:hypothetical protein
VSRSATTGARPATGADARSSTNGSDPAADPAHRFEEIVTDAYIDEGDESVGPDALSMTLGARHCHGADEPIRRLASRQRRSIVLRSVV